MRTYNYLSNELPRELIELYNDIEQDVLRIMVRELKNETQPTEVYAKIQQQVDSYNEKSQDVLMVIFNDSKKKSIKDGQADFKEEPENNKVAVDNGQANSLIIPSVVAGLSILSVLNSRIVSEATEEYTADFLQLQSQKQGISTGDVINYLKKIYNKLARNGITIKEAIRGQAPKAYSLENIIKRDVMYQVNKANAKINKENFNQSSAKFIETSSHPTARTWNKYMKHLYEDHSSWQGKCFYSRDGEKVEGYEEFESTCGYGEMLGIGGINCYHQFELNYTGEPVATQYTDKEVQKQYALSQKQRGLERNIRKLKSARAVYEEAGMMDKFKEYNVKVRMANSRLRDFCSKNNVKYYNWRTQI